VTTTARRMNGASSRCTNSPAAEDNRDAAGRIAVAAVARRRGPSGS
jgi:hypothetical protein